MGKKAKATSMKAMKGMKVMKAKRVSIIAKGKRARASVFRGSKVKTSGGMAKARADACKAARKALNLTGFVPIGGKSATGKALYAKAKALLKWRRTCVRNCCPCSASSAALRHCGF